MAKITQISFKNYRAFWGETDNEININGKNALIYGENGSGKSSLYQGLKDFFKAVDTTWTIEKTPIHLKADSDEYKIEVVFDVDGENPVSFSGQTIENEITGQTYLLNSFLSYKELLKTHFIEQHEFNEKFFELLTTTLLNEHEIGGSTVGKTFNEIKRLQKSRKQDDKTKSKELLDNFNAQFPAELTKISEQCGKILEYFNQGLKIEFQPDSVSFEKGHLKGNIGLKVDYIGKESVNHLEILNEARLSALAISIYLAAIVTNPIVPKANYKIIFLDDIFVGLDMSNRLPLLEILQKFSLDGTKPFFEDFQIFITTYDRYWFEIAKKHLKGLWEQIELYAGDALDAEKNKICDKPVIIQDNIEPLEKAKNFFEAFDYYSAGNYLRKALEKELERLVDITYRIETKDLESLISKLFDYYEKCNCGDLIPTELKSQLKMFKDSVLNPSSHYDLQSPLYKTEIETAFSIIKELQKLPLIKRHLLVGMRASLFYQNDEKNYKAQYILSENIYAIKIENNTPRISDGNHSVFEYKLNEITFSNIDGTVKPEAEIVTLKAIRIKLSERPAKLQHFLTLDIEPNWKDFTTIEEKTLQELADEN